MGRLKDYLQLVKLSLSIMVVFSSVISFMLSKGFEAYEDKWFRILMLFAGGMLVTGSANAINQITYALLLSESQEWREFFAIHHVIGS